jgi:hypothetical protein
VIFEPAKDFVATVPELWKPWIEPDDLEAVVHTRNEQVILAALGRMPFYTPDSAPNVSLLEWSKGFAYVEKANFFVIAEQESTRDTDRTASVGYLPTASRCSMWGWFWIAVIPDPKLP